MAKESRREVSICIDDVEPNAGREGINYTMMSGGDDGNWVHVLEVPPGYSSEAHYHDFAQFQVIIKGTVDMAGHVLTPGSLHYTDAGTPYGPFTAGPEGLTMMVIRPGADKKGRRVPTRTVIDQVKAAQAAQAPESA